MAGERNEGGEPEVLIPDLPAARERPGEQDHADRPGEQDHADRPGDQDHADRPGDQGHADRPGDQDADRPGDQDHAERPSGQDHADPERPDPPEPPDHLESPDSPGRPDHAPRTDEHDPFDTAGPLDPYLPDHPSGENAEEFLALLPGEEGEEEGFGRVVDAVRWGEETLRHAGVRGARLQATLLVGHALDMDRAQVLANLREPLDPADDARVRELIGRRAAHVPLQYLRGRAPFLDFDVEVEPGVFIPRPETELVVERALELWQPLEPWRRDAGGRWAVDVGTGSGIIAIALALARPWGRVLAIDVSPEALAVARSNARRLGVLDRIVFVRGDLLAPVGAGGLPPGAFRRAVGIVVSNPPYAPEDSQDVHHEVREHEPREAWAAGPTGLEVYRRLVPQAAALLLPGRPLVLELGYEQERAVPGLMAGDGRWGEPDIRPDFQGIPRVLTARRSAGFQQVERGGRRQVVRGGRQRVVPGGRQEGVRVGREPAAPGDDPPLAPGSPGPLS